MSEAKTTEQLRLLLDEVGFVYEHLPKTLERARKASRDEPWNMFFRDQASALRTQRESLRDTAEWWGMHTRPCFSSVVEKQLNEARLAVMDRRAKNTMEKTVQAVLNTLRTRVLSGLEEAVHLALRIRENDLAQRLLSLSKKEQLQLAVMQAPVADI